MGCRIERSSMRFLLASEILAVAMVVKARMATLRAW
jgi:hypothetical protein